MTNPYYENFIKEYESTAKEKVDGYTLSNFDRMNNKEKEDAFLLLSEELNKSSVAVDPLVYLNQEDAYPLLINKYENDKKNGHINYHIAAILYRCSENEVYVNDFISCYPNISDLEMNPYLNDAAKIKKDDIDNLLVTVINSRHKQYIRRQASIFLLERFLTTEQNRISLLPRLKDDNPIVRNEAVRDVFSHGKR